ncbi:NAD(P)/FAD-dependent oxidoreductase [Gracilibacillus phocaeensis]|uniref:NAD(P)/FAD-dependent oxidoreductase n=1 Tax=Gracilibacillus phocaeensis TaxID=2042304 RepID=UPI001030E8A0|nr:NAD(P)/FAD-dependent oxidoreductase [Gracilibacillus phocaeensis]
MDNLYDVIIVGAGPSGIGVASILQQMECSSYLVLEKEEVGASFLRWPEEMRFITPSFPAQGFGQTDLNAIVPKTSPAYTLAMEHPSGKDYAGYLQVIANHFSIPIKRGVEVKHIEKKGNLFTVETSSGVYQSRFLVWAAGEYQYPDMNPFPGAEFAIHNSHISSWEELTGDDFIVIGGYESGMDAAYQLGKLGKKVTVIAKSHSWELESSDPSIALSPYTYQRVHPLLDSEWFTLAGHKTVEWLEADEKGYYVFASDGDVYFSSEKPILATGFAGSTTIIENLVKRGTHHKALLNESDESVETSGLFLTGPELRHNDHIFCYIYKFRQRFAVIAEAIGEQLGLDLSVIETYQQENFYLNDLSMCGEKCQC